MAFIAAAVEREQDWEFTWCACRNVHDVRPLASSLPQRELVIPGLECANCVLRTDSHR